MLIVQMQKCNSSSLHGNQLPTIQGKGEMSNDRKERREKMTGEPRFTTDELLLIFGFAVEKCEKRLSECESERKELDFERGLIPEKEQGKIEQTIKHCVAEIAKVKDLIRRCNSKIAVLNKQRKYEREEVGENEQD